MTKRSVQQAAVDAYPADIRALVYEYGYEVVEAAIKLIGYQDATCIETFAKANRKFAQEKLEAEGSGFDIFELQRGFSRRT